MIEPFLDLEPTFARHETFHPRYGWLRKAVVESDADSEVFHAEDAPTRLGVGKNMVRAIRYWGRAFKVLRETKPEGTRLFVSAPTDLGSAIFGEEGADPYMEDPGTPWLLHWLLLRPPCAALVWSLAFNKFAAVEFTEDDLVSFVADIADRSWDGVAPASIHKDVACLLRMYARRPKARESIEDQLDCPFRDLGLIEPTADGAAYRFTIGRKSTLPDEVAIFAALDFLAFSGATGSTASVARLASAAGGPGRAFKLSETALSEILDRYAQQPGAGVRVEAPAGVTQMVVDGPPGDVAVRILSQYLSRIAGVEITLATDLDVARISGEIEDEDDPVRRLVLVSRRLVLTHQGALI